MKWPHELRSLRHPSLRLFFVGQSVSLLGSWIQPVATSWLSWRLTHSAETVGRVTFFSQVPTLLFGLYAGAIADRFPRRRVIAVALVNALVQAVILAALTFTGAVRPWHLFALAAMLGLTFAFEIPARQSMLADLAGKDIDNVVALNSTMVTLMRVFGPFLGGLIVGAFGEAWCFTFNAVSFLFVLGALAAMEVPHTPRQSRGTGRELLESLRYALKTPIVAAMLLLLVFGSLFGLSYGTLMPVFADRVLHGDATLLGKLLASAGIGAFLAAVTLLALPRTKLKLDRVVGIGATLMACGLLGLARVDSPRLAWIPMVWIGYGQILLSSGMLTLLQSIAPAGMRGRVMGLFTTIFVGVTPFGALAVGRAVDRFGAPQTLLVQGSALLLISAVFHLVLRGVRRLDLPPQPPDFGGTTGALP